MSRRVVGVRALAGLGNLDREELTVLSTEVTDALALEHLPDLGVVVHRVQHPVGLDRATGRHHDALAAAGMLVDELCNVVDAALVHDPDATGLARRVSCDVVLRVVRERRELLAWNDGRARGCAGRVCGARVSLCLAAVNEISSRSRKGCTSNDR